MHKVQHKTKKHLDSKNHEQNIDTNQVEPQEK